MTLLDDTPLIIAGGGGSGGSPKKQYEDGDPGQATENGTRCGGTGGNGGQPCNANTGNVDPGILVGGGLGSKATGGYSGGGVVGSSSSGVAGGGGSYNIGTNQQNKAGVNKGDGKVIITLKN